MEGGTAVLKWIKWQDLEHTSSLERTERTKKKNVCVKISRAKNIYQPETFNLYKTSTACHFKCYKVEKPMRVSPFSSPASRDGAPLRDFHSTEWRNLYRYSRFDLRYCRKSESRGRYKRSYCLPRAFFIFFNNAK